MREYLDKNGNLNAYNVGLTTLNGCPIVIYGGFYVASNKLTNLEYGPEYVKLLYDISWNPINSFKFLPKNCFKMNITETDNLPVLGLIKTEFRIEFFRPIGQVGTRTATNSGLTNCLIEAKKESENENLKKSILIFQKILIKSNFTKNAFYN